MRAGPATIRGTALMAIATDMPCARCWPATSPTWPGEGTTGTRGIRERTTGGPSRSVPGPPVLVVDGECP